MLKKLDVSVIKSISIKFIDDGRDGEDIPCIFDPFPHQFPFISDPFLPFSTRFRPISTCFDPFPPTFFHEECGEIGCFEEFKYMQTLFNERVVEIHDEVAEEIGCYKVYFNHIH